MKIIIAGIGKVGTTLTAQLAADGHDISWIWDADYEKVCHDENCKKIYVTGTRGEDMQLRLKYADVPEDKNAIKEAKALNIPVIALCDTNVDPSEIDYVIPMNDDSIKATKLVLDYFTEAIKAGKK